MWLLGRLRARRVAAVARARDQDAVRAYGRWLNEALGQLAEALLWTTPLATSGTSCDVGTMAELPARLDEAQRRLQTLLNAACLHEPPRALDGSSYAAAHAELIAVAQQSLVALGCLARGFAKADNVTIRGASAELTDLVGVAADLHGRTIEWALPFLLGPD
jgi:hypothetical protein